MEKKLPIENSQGPAPPLNPPLHILLKATKRKHDLTKNKITKRYRYDTHTRKHVVFRAFGLAALRWRWQRRRRRLLSGRHVRFARNRMVCVRVDISVIHYPSVVRPRSSSPSRSRLRRRCLRRHRRPRRFEHFTFRPQQQIRHQPCR